MPNGLTRSMVKIILKNFCVLGLHTPHFCAEGDQIHKIITVSLGPGLSYIADIGIKRTRIGKFIPNFQRNYRFNSLSLGDTSNFVNFGQFSMLFLAYDKKKRLIFDKYFSGCYILQKFLWRWEKWLKRSPFINASICVCHNQRWSREHKARGQRHKKIWGQGQRRTLRRKTLSRPRTRLLEDKDKDQGHNAEVFSPPQKKGLRQNFCKFSTKVVRQNFFFTSSLACSKTKLHCSWPSLIFNRSKDSAVLEPRTGHFRRLAGFEAKTKDLIFEAKD